MAARLKPIPAPAKAVDVPQLCADARRLAGLARYDEAEAAVAPVWAGVGARPDVELLPPAEAAQVLFITGLLTIQLGTSRGIPGALEQAKDLLTESQRTAEAAGDIVTVGDALSALGLCSARAGALDDAAVYLGRALELLPASSARARADVVVRLVGVAQRQRRPSDALRLLRVNRRLFGRRAFLREYAIALKSLLDETGLPEHAAAALKALTEARRLSAEAGHKSHVVICDNNAAGALAALGDYAGAHAALDRAEDLAAAEGRIDWRCTLRDTRARVLMAEGRLDEAEALTNENVRLLDGGEHKGLLCEALTTQGEIHALRRRYEDARTSFLLALEAAQFVDPGSARRAEEQLARIAKLASLRTFPWRMPEDVSMLAARMLPGRCYRFRRTGGTWRDGDIAVVHTPDGPFIAYIRDDPPDHVLLSWSDARCKPRRFPKDSITVEGVVCLA